MSRRFPMSTLADGDLATPHEVYDELFAVVDEMNGHIDRTNLSGEHVDRDTVEIGAAFAVHYASTSTQVVDAVLKGLNYKEYAGSELTFTSPEPCMLEIDATLRWVEGTTPVDSSRQIFAGIRLDGEIIERDFFRNGPEYNTLCITAMRRIPAGAHRVSLVYASYSEQTVYLTLDGCSVCAVERYR